MSLRWAGRFFTLWEGSRRLAAPCFRIGGPEAGGLAFDNPSSWAPGEDELYIALFEGLARRLRCDLFVSTMDQASWNTMARMLEPLETLAVPLEWDDHKFYVLSEEEFEAGEPTTHSTVCFSSPRQALRGALSWLWSTQSELWFPLICLLPRTRHALSRWHLAKLDEGDARDFLLQRYEGLLFIGCPRELYVTGTRRVVDAVIEVMAEIEQGLAQHDWLEKARAQLVCSEGGTYYREDDPRASAVKLAGRLLDLAA